MDIQSHALDALHNINTTDQPFDMVNAVVFVLGHDEKRTLITEYPDIYIALETITKDVARIDKAINANPLLAARALGVLTCGWAAPVDGGKTTPSRHPQRRRVRFAMIATCDLMIGSALEFQDDPESPIFDDGSASGALRDALLETVCAVIDYQSTMGQQSSLS